MKITSGMTGGAKNTALRSLGGLPHSLGVVWRHTRWDRRWVV